MLGDKAGTQATGHTSCESRYKANCFASFDSIIDFSLWSLKIVEV